ncbi:MAG: ATP-dependent protease subunit HslV [Spirochaetia bacterium]|nr:ATP-dependent protease subunit HslV [Spirochaetia bacterium]
MSFRGTTILAVKKDGKTAIAGDGQVTLGEAVMKGNARKVRRMYHDRIITGFAGATADAFTLFDLFEKKLNQFNGDLTRSAVEMAKEWRTDRTLRRLEAMMLVADLDKIYLISGTGDVIEPEYGAIAIGSGGNYAYAAAKAYLDGSDLTAGQIAQRSLQIASEICIYTNDKIIVEEV